MNRSDWLEGKENPEYPVCSICKNEFPFKDRVDELLGGEILNGGGLCWDCACKVSNNGHSMYGMPGICLKCSKYDRTIRCPRADEPSPLDWS